MRLVTQAWKLPRAQKWLNAASSLLFPDRKPIAEPCKPALGNVVPRPYKAAKDPVPASTGWTSTARLKGERGGANRRQALAMVFAGLAIAYAPQEAMARAIHGGIATAGAGSFVFLRTTTVSETSGVTQTNVPFEVYVPLDGVEFVSSSAFGAMDSDGITPLVIQQDNLTLDVAPADRGIFITGLLPTLTANQNRQISIGYYASTSPTAGTSITAAQIIATGYNFVQTCDSNDGFTYTASAAAGLAAGTWTNKTTTCNYGRWRGGGGVGDEFVVYAPFKNGGTAHPGNLYAKFTVAAFKLGRGAVSGGNPITAIRTKWSNGNAFVQQSSPIDCWYDLTVTSGSYTQAWVGSSPALTLTLSSNTASSTSGVPVTATTASGTPFSANSVGMVIADGTGYGTICGYNSPTSVKLMLFKPFASTTTGSGSWRVYGLNHPNGATTPPQTNWYSGLQQPALTTYLGAAYNSGTLAGGPGQPITHQAKVTRDYNTAAVYVTNSTANLTACGTNLMGYLSSNYGNGLAGDITMYMPQTGGRPDIADVPEFYVGALLKWDAAAPQVVFGNAAKACTIPVYFLDQTTGLTMRMDTGTDWYIDTGSSTGTQIQRPSPNIINWTVEINHYGHFFYLPYLLSGDYFWAEKIQSTAFYIWACSNTGYTGSQLNRIAAFRSGNQCRGVAWSLNKVVEAAFVTVNSPCLGWDKTHAVAWLNNHMTATNGGLGGVPYPGANISYTNNVGGVGKIYATSGPRWVGENGGNGGIFNMWMLHYLGHTMFKTKLMGMASPDFLNFITFVVEGMTYMATATADLHPVYMVPSYWIDNVFPYPSTLLKTGPDIYQAVATDPVYGNSRSINAGATLSGLSGTITCTFPAGVINNGGTAFYAGGIVTDGSGGIGIIVSVAGNVATLTTSGSTPSHDGNTVPGHAFTSTTLAANSYMIPWPAVGDSAGVVSIPYSSYYEYWDLAQTNAEQYAAGGYANGNTAKTTIDADYTGGNAQKWKCAA